MAGWESTVHLAAELASAGAARRFVDGELRGHVPAPVLADLVLATSELVTNAIEHARTYPGVDVCVRVDAGRACVVVRSLGDHSGLAEAELWATSPPDVPNGRGLGIVRNIADDVSIERAGDVVEITVCRTL